MNNESEKGLKKPNC